MGVSMARFFLVGLIVVLGGCTAELPRTPNGEPMAEIKGYSTPCNGKVRVVAPDSSKNSHSYSPAGPTHLVVEAESEPSYELDFSGDPAYMCAYVSRHNLTFDSKPGRSYRLSLVRTEPHKFEIEVRE